MDKKEITIAERLRVAMNHAGKRQADLVRETGLDRGSISSYLSGKYEPKQKAIYKLAKALDINEAWLLGYEVPMERSAESKKTDELARLVLKMKNNVEFFETVSALAELDEKQFRGVKDLVAALKK